MNKMGKKVWRKIKFQLRVWYDYSDAILLQNCIDKLGFHMFQDNVHSRVRAAPPVCRAQKKEMGNENLQTLHMMSAGDFSFYPCRLLFFFYFLSVIICREREGGREPELDQVKSNNRRPERK